MSFLQGYCIAAMPPIVCHTLQGGPRYDKMVGLIAGTDDDVDAENEILNGQDGLSSLSDEL